MKIAKVDIITNFKGSTNNEQPKKREFIDVIADGVKNPRDVNDCVAVPRGIFKAYIALMTGTALNAMANFLPKKADGLKKGVNIVGWTLNILSAYYFAKPFAFKGLSPTVTKGEVEEMNIKRSRE